MKDNCFNEFDPNALNVEEALSRILKSIVSKKDTELVPLKESYGRVLAKDIKSNQDIPNYKNSAMDGYAVCMDITNSNNKYTFRCVGESFAGRPYNKNVKINEAVKVMTGGMVPKSCNAVVMKELVKNIDDKTIFTTGNENDLIYPRSSVKIFQAIPFIESNAVNNFK